MASRGEASPSQELPKKPGGGAPPRFFLQAGGRETGAPSNGLFAPEHHGLRFGAVLYGPARCGNCPCFGKWITRPSLPLYVSHLGASGRLDLPPLPIRSHRRKNPAHAEKHPSPA